MRIHYNGFSYRIQVWQPTVNIMFLSNKYCNTNVWVISRFIQDTTCKGRELPYVVCSPFGYGQGSFHWPDNLNFGLCRHLFFPKNST